MTNIATDIALERRRAKRRRFIKKNAVLLSLAMPALLLVIVFCYLPMPGIVIAFKNYRPFKGIWGSDWVGFNNFKFFFTSQDAVRAIKNTVLYSGSFLILDLIFGTAIALMLYYLRSARSVKIYHTVLMLPKFLSIIIVSYFVYGMLRANQRKRSLIP